MTVTSSWPLPLRGGRIYMTRHALERYRERVRPHLDAHADLHRDICRLVRCAGELADEPPAWVNGNWDAEQVIDPRGWVVCGDVCMPLAVDRDRPNRWVALTVLTRGGISDEARASRNRHRATRTRAKRKRNKLDSRLNRGHNGVREDVEDA